MVVKYISTWNELFICHNRSVFKSSNYGRFSCYLKSCHTSFVHLCRLYRFCVVSLITIYIYFLSQNYYNFLLIYLSFCLIQDWKVYILFHGLQIWIDISFMVYWIIRWIHYNLLFNIWSARTKRFSRKKIWSLQKFIQRYK